MIILAFAMALAQDGPWSKYQQGPQSQSSQPEEGATATHRETGERLVFRNGAWRPILRPGPHTLIVSDGSAMTRMDYQTGSACQRAMETVQKQVAPPQNEPGIIYGPPRITAVCVPR